MRSLPCAVATMSSRILKPCVGELRRQLLEAIAAEHEEAAHGVVDLDPEHPPRDLGGERAGAGALLVKTVGAAAFDVAAADHEFGRSALEQLDHLRQLRLVMLQVGVDYRRIGRAGSQDALNAGAGKPAPPDPADAADAGILLGQTTHHIPGSIGGIVIDEDDLPVGFRAASRTSRRVQYR